jgi:hypothetical protein
MIRQFHTLVIQCVLIFVFIVMGFFSRAQQPAHFILGEEQFKGIQIYDIIQDDQLNYLFATSDGIYYFDYYKYHRIECANAKSLVVFNFVKNSQGSIYCNNLNNQVFCIKGKTCSLFYEIGLQEASSDVSLLIDKHDNIYIGTKRIIVINRNGNVLNRISVKGYLGEPLLLENNKVIYHVGNTNSLVVCINGRNNSSLLKVSTKVSFSEIVLRFFKFNGKVCAVDLKSRQLFSFDEQTYELVPLGSNEAFERGFFIRTYSTNGTLWVAGMIQGVSFLKEHILSKPNAVFFEDYFISNVFADKEGNILLGTFDKGIIVIPDMNVPDVIDTFEDDPVTSINLKSDSALYMGTSKGRLLKYEAGKIGAVSQDGKRPIEGVYTKKYSKYLIYDDGIIRFMDKGTEMSTNAVTASLKDAVIIDEQNFYLATNNGVIHYWFAGKNTWEYTWVEGLRIRTYAIDYSTAHKLIYVSSSDGVFALNLQHK